jgi:hypothetical protein
VDGLPILADDDFREAVSPKKPTRPLHRSLSLTVADENQDSDNLETRKIISEYQSRGGTTGRSLSSGKKQWIPPPLPSELREENEEEQSDDRYHSGGDLDESYYSDEEEGDQSQSYDSQESDYYSDQVTQSSTGNEELIQSALEVFCEQKRNTIQGLRAKKAQTKDPFLF